MTHTKQDKVMKVDTMKKWMDYARKFDIRNEEHGRVELYSDERDTGVIITTMPFGRIAVSASGRFGGVKMSHHRALSTVARIEECGHLIEHGGPSAFNSFGGASAKTWCPEMCLLDLEALIAGWVDSVVDMLRDEDFDGARGRVVDIRTLREFITACEYQDFSGWTGQAVFIQYVNDTLCIDDLGETGIYECGETLTDDCWWTLAMLWRASELLVARRPGKLPL